MKTVKSLFYSLTFLALLLSNFIAATTIQKFTFEEMVDLSELIIEAEVSSQSLYSSGELVYTRVLFKIHDVLKGDEPGEFIELDFLGGEQDGKTVSISGQDIPAKGEHGFYFIEATTTKSVNPLIGWSQGHFTIITDDKGNETLESDVKQGFLEITDTKDAAMAAKLRNLKFSSQLVEEAYFTPVTPDELRDAVDAFIGE